MSLRRRSRNSSTRSDKESAAKKESERIDKESVAKKESEHIDKECAEKVESERVDKESAETKESERIDKESAEKMESLVNVAAPAIATNLLGEAALEDGLRRAANAQNMLADAAAAEVQGDQTVGWPPLRVALTHPCQQRTLLVATVHGKISYHKGKVHCFVKWDFA